ncbi:serine/threonine-protein kinase [Candidatus Uabimicrobium sp. HlEnr_7]|uniref:serine/threonine-protein kinase n=1 Tax=Candidatus Uabimicrobium helgolandensis TaxID=3095367 RepID=UPI003556E4C8
MDDIRKKWNRVIGDATLDQGDPGQTYKKSQESITAITKSNIEETMFDEPITCTEVESGITPSPQYQSEQYNIMEEIARGGMGIVYSGTQYSLQREVAVKKLINTTRKEMVSKFIAESLVTAYLDHPNIVPVYDLVQGNGGELFLSMKMVRGVSWKSILYPETTEQKEISKKYTLEKYLEVLLDVCNAISFAHSKEIVHNDIKLSNIMVGEFGEVLVMDWGIALDINKERSEDSGIFHKSMINTPMGTPCYIPSELAEGKGENIGPWTDVYLLGSTLYEILMKNPPHKGSPLEAIMSSILGKELVFDDSIPRELQSIVNRAMALRPQDRYQSAQEFKKAIEVFLRHRESLELTKKASEIYNVTIKSFKDFSWRAFFANFTHLFFNIPGKIIFPYWWYSSSKKGRVVYGVIFICLIFIAETLYELTEIVLFGLLSFNIFYIARQYLQYFIFRTQIGKRHQYHLEISDRNRIYSNFIRAITLYERAIELWPENEQATQQKQSANLLFAQVTIHNRDVGLAEMYLDQLDCENPKVQKVHSQLRQAKIELKSDAVVLWLSKVIMAIVFYLALIEIYAFFVVPLLETKIERNERLTIETLYNISNNQVAFRDNNFIDQDIDGKGEYGFLRELIEQSLLTSFEKHNNLLTAHGYYYYCYLPGNVYAIGENDSYFEMRTPQQTNMQEKYYLIYAWPKDSQTGKRAFVIGPAGKIYTAEQHNYTQYKIPHAQAAFLAVSKNAKNIEGFFANNNKAIDQNVWYALIDK